MKRSFLLSLAILPLIAGCGSVSVGVGVGGASGGLGAGVGVSTDVGSGARTGSGVVVVPMFKITSKGVGEEIGTLMLMDSRGGLRIAPALGSLPPGAHGFHMHEVGDCGPGMKDGKTQAGIAAGGHYDPHATGKHAGPTGDGHKGDLPVLMVDKEGNATATLHALHLSVNDARGRSFVVHKGDDNFSDQPKPLGGGGERIVCGVVPVAG
jgi:Cu-Zn family superoxide dismutase